jgi:hypothetical protein
LYHRVASQDRLGASFAPLRLCERKISRKGAKAQSSRQVVRQTLRLSRRWRSFDGLMRSTDTTLSLEAARALMLAAMGLDRPPARRATKPALLAAIRRMGALQIDTIHVVARSPYLVLWSRLGDYEPRWLEELLAEGKLFEYWSHEACFLPTDDYPLYRRFMLDGQLRWKKAPAWIRAHPDEVARILAHVRERGGARSADFARTDGKKGGWWEWKPEKLALEVLHCTGELMIAARQNFHRVYDLRERILPDWRDADAPPLEEVRRALALKAVRALGVATARWVPDYFRTPKAGAAALLERLADEGALVRVALESAKEPAYVHPENKRLLAAAAAGRREPSLVTLLSPFDPLVWHRERASALFGFDYRLECYTPAPKRRYGYFSLPILRRGRLVGRLDPKAHRSEGVFEVKSLHLEPGVRPDADLAADLAGALARLAAWHATPRVVVGASDPPAFARRLSAALRARPGPS